MYFHLRKNYRNRVDQLNHANRKQWFKSTQQRNGRWSFIVQETSESQEPVDDHERVTFLLRFELFLDSCLRFLFKIFKGRRRFKKVSLCDDYSLPVDHVNKKRPNSFAAPSLSEWNVSSPNDEQIEISETYSNPKDSKIQLNQSEEAESKYYTSPDREYSQPYTTDGSSEPSSNEEYFGHASVAKPLELNSPDSITEAILPLVNLQSPERLDIKRHSSPYYYADLYKSKGGEEFVPLTKCSNSTRNLEADISGSSFQVHHHYHHHHHHHQCRHKKSSSVDDQEHEEDFKHKTTNARRCKKSFSLDSQSIESNVQQDALNYNYESDCVSMPPNRLLSPCSCVLPEDSVDEDDMTRQRHVYETAFDCRISKSDDDLDQIDKVSNHSVLVQLNTVNIDKSKDIPHQVVGTLSATNVVRDSHTSKGNNNNNNNKCRTSISPSQSSSIVRHSCIKVASTSATCQSVVDSVSQNLEEMHLNTAAEEMTLAYTPSPPSTAPLPAKFHGKQCIMNSIRSTPSLPASNQRQQQRLKDMRLPVKSLRGRAASTAVAKKDTDITTNTVSANDDQLAVIDFKSKLLGLSKEDKEQILEIKDRPALHFKHQKDCLSKDGRVLEYKNIRRRHKYSSNESMTTSSSGDSMESLRSSTSEGNRSTTSSESRHSTSLSSHSSDSSSMGYLSHHIQTSSFLTNKLHILSPISDKSSQEPISETSDNRNNGSQKCSPDDGTPPEPAVTTCTFNINTRSKKRMPPNKNLLTLAEIQGSDSGISIQSRDGVKSRIGFASDVTGLGQDFSDLPFDMPKLRRRRLAQQQNVCTSGSTTSVDLRELPFDMPKLKRRLRIPQSSTDSGVSQASSSQSVLEADKQQVGVFRPKLTLNLNESGVGGSGPRLRPSLGGMGLNLNIASNTNVPSDLIDVSLPLERQGWYHGAITRIEAECVLRLLREGSFLVRNSESTRQDYSLSLKSARGFMHMRIQRSGADGTFILGQFSKPFHSIPEMIRHFSLNRLPVRGAEHMCLLQPVIAQLL